MGQRIPWFDTANMRPRHARFRPATGRLFEGRTGPEMLPAASHNRVFEWAASIR